MTLSDGANRVMKVLGMISVAALVAGTLAACVKPVDTAFAESQAYCAARYGAPELQPLRGRIAFSFPEATQMTVAMLSDHARPSESEVVTLKAFAAARQDCNNRVDAARGRVEGWVAKVRSVTTPALADLIGQNMTFAEYNRIIAREVSAAKAELDEIDRQANRDAAVINAIKAPTSCTRIGNTVTCF